MNDLIRNPKKFRLSLTIALTSSGLNVFSSLFTSTFTTGFPDESLEPSITRQILAKMKKGTKQSKILHLNGKSFASDCTVESSNFLPINRFMSNIVLAGLFGAWFLAASPINRCPSAAQATYDGVIRLPCSFGHTSTRPFRHTATQLQVGQHKTSKFKYWMNTYK